MSSEKTRPRVSIIILNWNNYAATKRCLGSLAACTYPNRNTLIVDNASVDDSLSRLRREFGECSFLLNEENLGFARACNRGMRRALQDLDCQYVLLLNNDMEVAADFLESAISLAEHDRSVGLLTGKILFGDKRNVIWQAGGEIDRLRIQARQCASNELDRGQCDELRETEWAAGAMLLIPRRTLESVGHLPEEYFFGTEEWDYSTAVTRAGKKILYVPDFKGYHYTAASYKVGHPVLTYNAVRNKLVYAQKYLSPAAWFVWRILFKCYLIFLWPKKARSGCGTEQDYRARLTAARLAFADHRGIRRIELNDLRRAGSQIGPTPTWGNDWARATSTVE